MPKMDGAIATIPCFNLKLYLVGKLATHMYMIP